MIHDDTKEQIPLFQLPQQADPDTSPPADSRDTGQHPSVKPARQRQSEISPVRQQSQTHLPRQGAPMGIPHVRLPVPFLSVMCASRQIFARNSILN